MDQMNRQDWTLLAISFGGEAGLSPVQLQKSLFLLGRELPEDLGEFYTFVAHNYGPFSKAIYHDAELLAGQGLVAISSAPWQSYPVYRVTGSGAARAEALVQSAGPAAAGYLRTVVKWARSRSFAELVSAIYAKYPEFRVNSVFQY
jgi:hypothetical protein